MTSAKFYSLNRSERQQRVSEIQSRLEKDISNGTTDFVTEVFSDSDTYIRKAAYLSVGRIYFAGKVHESVIELLNDLLASDNPHIRQTAINAAGEIGKRNFEAVRAIFDTGLLDSHHAPRNAVIGSIKKMGEVNPKPVLKWAKKYLHHKDKEIRREICHGIELRGRKHPGDVLPLLEELQHDNTARVRSTLVHVIGQIAYKEGCLPVVVAALKTWKNKELVNDALEEVINVHHRYRDFAALTQQQARKFIDGHFRRSKTA